MWSDLLKPWQACFELAWEAYCEDCIPIGAVVTDENGKILSRGRNRVYPRWMWEQRPSTGADIAHAEVESKARCLLKPLPSLILLWERKGQNDFDRGSDQRRGRGGLQRDCPGVARLRQRRGNGRRSPGQVSDIRSP
jgi:hypothetical protein